MIREFLTYLSNYPKNKRADAFGHLSQSISLIARENRCKKFWQTHRDNSKKQILQELENSLDFDAILILGPGPMHEIPIEEISQKFKRVVLVDIVHLNETKNKFSHLKNLEFINHDISELEEIIQLHKKLINVKPQKFLNESWGFVISSNIMSQIPLHFEEYVQKHYPHLIETSILEDFLKQVSHDHFNYLLEFKAPVLLITDVESHYCDKNGRIFQIDKNFEHLNLGTPLLSWDWDIAPIPEFRKDVGIMMVVNSFLLNKKK